jgi:hypothetical protein
MKLTVLLSTVVLSLAPAAPCIAAPNPSPTAPAHTATACEHVVAHNPQAGAGSHSAPPAQTNFQAVGAAFCGF